MKAPLIWFVLTAYCPGLCCTPGHGRTSAGVRPVPGFTLACDPSLMEWQRVLDNIADPNTEAEATRTIRLTVRVRPDVSRERADVQVKAESKLAALRPAGTVVYIGRHEGQVVAIESDPKQLLIPLGDGAPQGAEQQPKRS